MAETKEYRAWLNAQDRCNNPNFIGYADYGGRGISFHEGWTRFEVFLADVGPAPSRRHSLDRINNEGNYEPGNVRWATSKEQARNRRDNRSVSYQGQQRLVADLADIAALHGVSAGLLHGRLRLGWSAEEAVNRPPLRGRNLSEIARNADVQKDKLYYWVRRRGLSIEEGIAHAKR